MGGFRYSEKKKKLLFLGSQIITLSNIIVVAMCNIRQHEFVGGSWTK